MMIGFRLGPWFRWGVNCAIATAVFALSFSSSVSADEALAGEYTGDFTGSLSGSLQFTISSDGTLTGTGNSGGESFPITGSVPYASIGNFSGSVDDLTLAFSGEIDSNGNFTGDWNDDDEPEPGSGTFSASKSSTDEQTINDAQRDLAINSINIQRNSFYRRIENLRGGARGVDLSGLSFNYEGLSLNPDMFTTGTSGLARLGMALGSAFENGGSDPGYGRRAFVGEGSGKGSGRWVAAPAFSAEDRPKQVGEFASGSSGAASSVGGSGWGAFLAGNVTLSDRDDVGGSSGSDTNTYGLSLGIDKRSESGAVLGLGVGYTRNDSDFNAGGGMKANAAYLIGYGSRPIGENGYIDGILSAGWIGYDTTRLVGANLVTGDTDGGQAWGGITGGYDFSILGFRAGPYGRLNGGGTFVAPYQENGIGAQVYDRATIWSLSTVVGVRADRAFSTEIGIISPYLRVEYEHEFGDAPSNEVAFVGGGLPTTVTTSIDRNVINLGGGVTVVLRDGWSVFVDYDGLLAADNLSRDSITFGGRVEF